MTLSPTDSLRLGHLLRRAGFGARPDEWTDYARLGVAGSTDILLHPERVPDTLNAVLHDISGDYVDFDNLDSVRNWWLYRMSHTPRPLEEKMTLFWHNHFATANYKVDNPQWMWQQNQLFRKHALGNFRTLLQGVSRDPAMLVWLDGEENRKGKANENYGRELQELFTLGIGNYTEDDVKAASRAFTGWRFDRESGTFLFDAASHDDDLKTFHGETGNFDGDDILDILVRNPATAKFLCTKLFKFFVHDNPKDEEVKPLTDVYFASGYDIRSVVGAIFTSPAFYSEQALYTKIKSPTEYIVTILRTLDVPLAAANRAMPVGNTLRLMGQDLFNPPNVKGWAEGQSWMNTMTLLTRINFANLLTSELSRRNILSPNLHRNLNAYGMDARQLNTPAQIVEAIWSVLLPGRTPSGKTQDALVTYVQDSKNPTVAQFEAKAPGLVSLILSAPEYQLA